MATPMENDHLIFMLDKLLPGSMGGYDYEVITEYEADGETLKEQAKIHTWNLSSVEQPTQETLLSLWANTYDAKHQESVAAKIAEEEARIQAIIDNSLL